MNIKLEHFGPVSSVDYDLSKNIIITYGGNNIGKSYSMKIIYLVLKYMKKMVSFIHLRAMYAVDDKGDKDIRYLIQHEILDFIDSDKNSHDITAQVERSVGITIQVFLVEQLRNALINTFNTQPESKTGDALITIIFDNKQELKIYPYDDRVEYRNPKLKPIILKKTSHYYHKHRNLSKEYDIFVQVSPDDKGRKYIRIPLELTLDYISGIASDIVDEFDRNIGNVYYLPASRSGISLGLNSIAPLLAKMSQKANLLTNATFSLPNIPEPVSDYYINITSINSKNIASSDTYAKEIEHDIINGTVKFDDKTKSLVYHDDQIGMDFGMSDVSTMVSELSPLITFLRYQIDVSSRAKSGGTPVIFIEEPEAHLHPENQVKLIRILAQLAQNGIKLMISSHSNYVFNALNNMILGSELDYKTYDPIYMKKDITGSIALHMKIDKLGAQDDNFAGTAQKLYEERQTYIEELVRNGKDTGDDSSD